jgi:hypothetical protein
LIVPNPKSPDDDDVELVEIEEDEPSDETLARAPGRVFEFVEGVAHNDPALLLLLTRGYSEDVHSEGWSLLQASAKLKAPSVERVRSDPKVKAAIEAVDAWDNEHFEIIQGIVGRKFSAQKRALFRELKAEQGAASVIAVNTLLERLAALSKGKLTDDSKSDKEADALLEKRGYTHEVRAELAEKVALAKALPELKVPNASAVAERNEARRAALLELHGWWKEWATIARKVIKRRDLLVNLGLAVRKKRVSSGPTE